jgi:hypothetical protein
MGVMMVWFCATLPLEKCCVQHLLFIHQGVVHQPKQKGQHITKNANNDRLAILFSRFQVDAGNDE